MRRASSVHKTDLVEVAPKSVLRGLTHVAYLEAGTISGDQVVALSQAIGIASALGVGVLAVQPGGEESNTVVSAPVREVRR